MEKQINYIYLTKQIRTTKEGIERLFGDLVNDFNSITKEEFEQIINRCNENEWIVWKENWKKWKESDFNILD